jgi:hypothetical protein
MKLDVQGEHWRNCGVRKGFGGEGAWTLGWIWRHYARRVVGGVQMGLGLGLFSLS